MGCENGSPFILHVECYWAQFSSNLVLVQSLKGREDSELLRPAACNVCQLLVCYHAQVLGSCISIIWLGPSLKNWDLNLFWDRIYFSLFHQSSSDYQWGSIKQRLYSFSTLAVLKKCKSCNGQVYFYYLVPTIVSVITCIFLGQGPLNIHVHIYIH